MSDTVLQPDQVSGAVARSDHIVPYPDIVGIAQLQAVVAGSGNDIIVSPYIGHFYGEVANALADGVGVQKVTSDLNGVHPAFYYINAARQRIADMIPFQQNIGSGSNVNPIFSGLNDGVVANNYVSFQVIALGVAMAGNGIFQVEHDRVFDPTVLDQNTFHFIVQ